MRIQDPAGCEHTQRTMSYAPHHLRHRRRPLRTKPAFNLSTRTRSRLRSDPSRSRSVFIEMVEERESASVYVLVALKLIQGGRSL
jgi:hypothetical protein